MKTGNVRKLLLKLVRDGVAVRLVAVDMRSLPSLNTNTPDPIGLIKGITWTL